MAKATQILATEQPDAFDALAAAYDAEFTETALGRLLRARVWRLLEELFPAGSHVLELGCGTGEDALALARKGVSVVATDSSSAMLARARSKAAAVATPGKVGFAQLSWQTLVAGGISFGQGLFDGAFTNFGGLNTTDNWRGVARSLSVLIRPGGALLVVPMGPRCPWETAWYLLHMQPATAVRRWRQPALAQIGEARIPIWYPSARALRHAFQPWFEPVQLQSLGLLLPPSYLGHLVARWPRLFQDLARVEKRVAPWTRDWGDHYIAVFARRDKEREPIR
jgi:ubiquinone/menaquinone biosynthesis C-methylase UbiE